VVFVDVMDVVISVDTLCVMMVVVNSLHIKSIHVGDICGVLVIQSHVVLAHVVFVKPLIIRLSHVR
jgi:hypothetical protein